MRRRQLVKLPGKYLMPGLWDMHVHFGGGEALIEKEQELCCRSTSRTASRPCAMRPATSARGGAPPGGAMSRPARFRARPSSPRARSWKGIKLGVARRCSRMAKQRRRCGAALDTLQGPAGGLREDHGEHAHARALYCMASLRAARRELCGPRRTCRWPDARSIQAVGGGSQVDRTPCRICSVADHPARGRTESAGRVGGNDASGRGP